MDYEKMNLQVFVKMYRSLQKAENALTEDEFVLNIDEVCTIAIDHYVRIHGKNEALARIEEVMETIYGSGAKDREDLKK
jgi:hypothetical protein